MFWSIQCQSSWQYQRGRFNYSIFSWLVVDIGVNYQDLVVGENVAVREYTSLIDKQSIQVTLKVQMLLIQLYGEKKLIIYI